MNSPPDPLLLGIEIGGTKLQLGLGRGDGRILALERRAIEPARGAEGILAQIYATTGPLLTSWGDGQEAIAAVGIGFGGPVDAEQGVVTTSHQVAGWDGFPLASWVRGRLGVPLVALQNDADTAGLGEAWFGAGAGISPLLYVTIGSGIGGGLIIDGEIYRGSGAGAMEIGHLEVVLRSDVGLETMTLESVASGWSIGSGAREDARRLLREGRTTNLLLRLVDGDPDRITAVHVAEAARQADPLAASTLKRAVDAIAQALNHAVTLVAPRRIILGGGVSLIGEELWLEPIRQQLASIVFAPFRGTFDIVPAALGEPVVIHGALASARALVRKDGGNARHSSSA